MSKGSTGWGGQHRPGECPPQEPQAESGAFRFRGLKDHGGHGYPRAATRVRRTVVSSRPFRPAHRKAMRV